MRNLVFVIRAFVWLCKCYVNAVCNGNHPQSEWKWIMCGWKCCVLVSQVWSLRVCSRVKMCRLVKNVGNKTDGKNINTWPPRLFHGRSIHVICSYWSLPGDVICRPKAAAFQIRINRGTARWVELELNFIYIPWIRHRTIQGRGTCHSMNKNT